MKIHFRCFRKETFLEAFLLFSSFSHCVLRWVSVCFENTGHVSDIDSRSLICSQAPMYNVHMSCLPYNRSRSLWDIFYFFSVFCWLHGIRLIKGKKLCFFWWRITFRKTIPMNVMILQTNCSIIWWSHFRKYWFWINFWYFIISIYFSAVVFIATETSIACHPLMNPLT